MLNLFVRDFSKGYVQNVHQNTLRCYQDVQHIAERSNSNKQNQPEKLTTVWMTICEDWFGKWRFISIRNTVFGCHKETHLRSKAIPDSLSVESKMQNKVYRKIASIKKKFNSQIKTICIYMQRSAWNHWLGGHTSNLKWCTWEKASRASG